MPPTANLCTFFATIWPLCANKDGVQISCIQCGDFVVWECARHSPSVPPRTCSIRNLSRPSGCVAFPNCVQELLRLVWLVLILSITVRSCHQLISWQNHPKASVFAASGRYTHPATRKMSFACQAPQVKSDAQVCTEEGADKNTNMPLRSSRSYTHLWFPRKQSAASRWPKGHQTWSIGWKHHSKIHFGWVPPCHGIQQSLQSTCTWISLAKSIWTWISLLHVDLKVTNKTLERTCCASWNTFQFLVGWNFSGRHSRVRLA